MRRRDRHRIGDYSLSEIEQVFHMALKGYDFGFSRKESAATLKLCAQELLYRCSRKDDNDAESE